MGTFTATARQKSRTDKTAALYKDATVNRAGGVAFEIQDAATKLVTMTGGSFFAEPRYYSATGRKELEARLDVVDGRLQGFASCEELDDVAREIVSTALAVADSSEPRDLLAIANWLRNEVNIRLTPQILLVLASRHPATKPFVKDYATKVVVRPDEVKSCLLAHRFFFGYKCLANCLDAGLGEALSKFGEAALMKYDSPHFPTWKDVLGWITRKVGSPLPKPLADYFVKGDVSDATPIVKARKELGRKTVLDDEAKLLIKASRANWEVVLSQFGKTDTAKAWECLLELNMLGYMALLRNLRNLLEAKVSQEALQMAADKLSDPDEVRRSRQLPFRFMMAHEVLGGPLPNRYGNARYGRGSRLEVDTYDAGHLLEAIEEATAVACERITALPGVTAIFADNSGSMDQTLSDKSKVSVHAVANMLCGMVAKRAEKPYVCAFATDVAPVTFTKNDTPISIARRVGMADTHGCSTNGHLCFEWLMSKGICADRVIMLSDMQCWDDYSYGDGDVQGAWTRYKRTVPGASKTWFHSVFLNGYGDSPANPRDAKVNLVSGFSEKVFDMLLQAEGVLDPATAPQLPTIEQIRQKW